MHRLVVKLKSLQVDQQGVGKLLAAEARALHRVHLLAALLAEPLVVGFQELALDVRREGLDEVPFVSHVDGDVNEILEPLRPVLRALATQHLVDKLATHDSLHRSLHAAVGLGRVLVGSVRIRRG